MTDPTMRDWESDLQFNVMEDYLRDAEYGYVAENSAIHLELMRAHFKKLKDFIRNERAAAKAEGYEKGKEDAVGYIEENIGISGSEGDVCIDTEVFAAARSLTDPNQK